MDALSLRLSEVASAHGGRVQATRKTASHTALYVSSQLSIPAQSGYCLYKRRTRDRLKSKMNDKPFLFERADVSDDFISKNGSERMSQ